MKIEVTQEDIDKARMLIATGHLRTLCCPVNLAAKRVTKNRTRTHSTYLHVQKGKKDHTHRLPEEVVDFIEKFDTGKQVKPITFETTFYKTF